MILNLLEVSGLDIFTQLEIEEALIKTRGDSWCLFNERPSKKQIVLGISNKIEELIDLEKVKKDKVDIIRRFSGGGTVIVDKNSIFVTFIFSKNLLSLSFPQEILRWTEKLFKKVFDSHDFSLKENDYVLKDKKCCGNAQYIKKDRWLHHSCFLWDYNIENMDYLKMPPKIPIYRNNRVHKDFLSSINSYFPSKRTFIEKLIVNLKKEFNLQLSSLEEVKKSLSISYSKATKLISSFTDRN
jgi:lipoate---protein ligase